jgi:hypothetical protein
MFVVAATIVLIVAVAKRSRDYVVSVSYAMAVGLSSLVWFLIL